MNKIEEIKKKISKAEDDNWAFGMERYTERNRHFE